MGEEHVIARELYHVVDGTDRRQLIKDFKRVADWVHLLFLLFLLESSQI